MEASGQLHALTALPLRNTPSVPTDYESRWATETDHTFWRRDKSPVLVENRTTIRWFSRQCCSHYTDWATPDPALCMCASNWCTTLWTLGTAYIFCWTFYLAQQPPLPPSPPSAGASSFTRFLDHTSRHTTVGRSPTDEWLALRRDLYLTIHNTHTRQTSMPLVGFEPTISAGERPPTHALYWAAAGSGFAWIRNCGSNWQSSTKQTWTCRHRKFVPACCNWTSHKICQ